MKWDCYIVSCLYFLYQEMKDSIKRICIGIVTGALLAYLVYLFTQDIAIVQSVFVQYSSLYF